MGDVRCPVCGKLNPEELEKCQFCGALLTPPADAQSIKPGEEPTRKDTSVFEKTISSGELPIHPGELPTKKNTADLEPALPSWLRTLRDGKRPAAGESLAEPSSEESLPPFPQATPGPDSSEVSPDWLSGLRQAGSEDEEVPDWLAGLRSGKSGESAPAPVEEDESTTGSESPDSAAHLGGGPQEITAEPPAVAQPPAAEQPAVEASVEPSAGSDIPDWLQSMQSPQSGALEQSEKEQPAFKASPQPVPGEETPDWLQSLQSPQADAQEQSATKQPAFEASPEPVAGEETPDWLQSLQSSAQEQSAAQQGEENLPEWLSGLPESSAESKPALNETGEPAPTESTPDWLDQLNQKSISSEPDTPAGAAEPAPDWLSKFGPAEESPASPSGEKVPERPSNQEEKSLPGAVVSGEPQDTRNPPAETPGWLSQLQADVNAAQDAETHKDDFEVVSESPASQGGTESLPDWLTGIESSGPSGNTPALIVDSQGNPPGEQGENAFSMETPDWLSRLNPEQASEKAVAGNEGEPGTENLEEAELPSWVQAMRPVESVVEAKTSPLDEDQSAELSGPLAGLRGVLPAGPGLGPLRKPPAYSMKLQVSEGQSRYASSLDRLVAGEALPRTSETKHLASNRLLRWLITALLLLAVGLPFVSGAGAKGVQIAPETLLGSTDMGASAKIIDGLSGNVPVLVVFDYEPALSGELEAVAAPIMDQLLSRGVPLALISTSPTGPALAEHFLQTTSLVNVHQYQSGVQYADLGYLAGGPAGILYFADAPTEAVTVTVDRQPAWGTGPLRTIRNLSDFAATIVITDNSDTGRNWIEQAGPRLGSTPMIMIISAQAEPMIRPYFDSGQLKGLVSGLSDAKIYEQTYNRPGLANQYWDSFSIGMLVAELLILVGVVLGVVTDWRACQKSSGKGA